MKDILDMLFGRPIDMLKNINSEVLEAVFTYELEEMRPELRGVNSIDHTIAALGTNKPVAHGIAWALDWWKDFREKSNLCENSMRIVDEAIRLGTEHAALCKYHGIPEGSDPKSWNDLAAEMAGYMTMVAKDYREQIDSFDVEAALATVGEAAPCYRETSPFPLPGTDVD